MSDDSITIEVPYDTTTLSDDDAATLINILNGLVYLCEHHNWFGHGHRNETILNMTVSAWMLGLDPEDVLDKLVGINIINPNKDDEDPYNRMRRMLNYTNRFSIDYMINTAVYAGYGQNVDSPDLYDWSVKFKLIK